MTPSQLPHHRTYGSVYGGSRGALGVVVACRARLTRTSPTLGGSAAYPRGTLRPLSLLVGVCSRHRTFRAGSAPRVRPFTTVRWQLLWPRLTPDRYNGQVSRGKTRDLHPINPPHLLPHLPGDYRASDLVASSPRCGCLLCGSCSSGRGFACSFLPTTPHGDAVAVRLAVPSHQGPQRTCTSKSLPGSLSLAG